MHVKKSYPYKRVDFFVEWIRQTLPFDIPDIPDGIYHQIVNEIEENNMDGIKLTFLDVKRALKKLNLTRYYEYVPYILCKLQDIPIPNIDHKTEIILKKMFIQICEVYDECRPSNRLSFISHAYVLHKLCELLERNDLLLYIQLGKSRQKLLQHDGIWKKICIKLGWQFMPTV